MTFAELRAQFQREVISDRSEDVWTGDEVLAMLRNASVEIAAMLGFPQAFITQELAAGASAIPAPDDLLNVELQQVSIDEWDLDPRPMIHVVRRRAHGSGNPDIYNYDPRRGGDIEFAPALAEPGTAMVEYTRVIDKDAITEGDEAWDGLFPQWHWLLLPRAGESAWKSVQDFERATYFQNEFHLGMASLAAYLGVPNPVEEMNRASEPGQPRRRTDSAEVS